MSILRFFLLSALIVCIAPVSGETSGLWLYEQATPDMGTAAAGRVSLASDAPTASVNLAGITRLDRSQMLAGGRL